MKPTKDTITPEKFFIKKNTPESDENGSYDFAPFPEQTMDLDELYELLQEYAELYLKEKLGEELIKFQTYCNDEQILYVSDFIIDEYFKQKK